ncbi:MAG: hypothetical protein PHG95_02170 [Patescibacteria group bacterium]|nr:hypothetical protein [Patescibacteria group bacterium]
MKKELIFPLIAGLILGVLVMLFWQLNAKLNTSSARLAQLEQATNSNTQAVSEIVGFINQATGQNGQNGAANGQTPATTPAQ